MSPVGAAGPGSRSQVPASRRGHARPRLLHLTTTDMSLDWLLKPQLLAFADAGYEVIGASAPGPHVADLEASGIRHIPLDHATRSMNLQSDMAALREVAQVLKREQPDILHTHNPKPGVYGRIAGRIARVPVIVNTQHGLYAVPEDPLAKRLAVYGLERVAAACSHAELVQSADDVATLRRLRVPARRLRHLGNGIDLDRFDPSSTDPDARERLRREVGASDSDVVVGAVGRLVAEKGFRELFEAARAIAPRGGSGAGTPAGPGICFVVIGPTDPDKADAMTAGELASVAEQARVTFTGERSDVEDWYAAMDVYVLASWREGFPRSSMEAAAMGLPIVTTDVRGCRHAVDDGRTGVLVPVRDPRALAAAILHLAGDSGLREAMGQAAMAKAAAEFDQRRVVDVTLETYDRLLRR